MLRKGRNCQNGRWIGFIPTFLHARENAVGPSVMDSRASKIGASSRGFPTASGLPISFFMTLEGRAGRQRRVNHFIKFFSVLV